MIMVGNDTMFPDYIAFPRTFEKYKWYKPILVLIIGLIVYAVLAGMLFVIFFWAMPLILCLVLIPLQCIEEYMFRGFIMQTFGSWFKIPILGFIIQALIFTALHPHNIIRVVSVFVLAIIYGLLLWKTNELEASDAVHSINNLSGSMWLLLDLIYYLPQLISTT